MSEARDINGLSCGGALSGGGEDMSSIIKSSWPGGNSEQSPNHKLPFNSSARQGSESVLSEPDCWAYQPLSRFGLQSNATTMASPHQLIPPSIITTTHRSVSFSDQFDQHGSEYGSPRPRLKYRERVSSLPTGSHLQDPSLIDALPLVDDIFPNVTPEPIEPPITQYQAMVRILQIKIDIITIFCIMHSS